MTTEARRTVFISCGQFLESEKALGREAAELVTKLTPFQGYFAENQSDLRGVTESILARLYNSVGFIAIMHDRGRVTLGEKTTARASVWIEQEIAIAAFMGQILDRPLHTLAYYEHGIPLEGVRQFILLNAKPFRSSEEVICDLEAQLPKWKTPLYDTLTPGQREAIQRKLTVNRIFAIHPQLTVSLTNRSASSVWVKSVSLWHGQKRLNHAKLSDSRDSVEIPPNRENVVIAFVSDEDAKLKLESLGIVEKHLPSFQLSETVDVELRAEYETVGGEDEFRETVRVRVQWNRQVESL